MSLAWSCESSCPTACRAGGPGPNWRTVAHGRAGGRGGRGQDVGARGGCCRNRLSAFLKKAPRNFSIEALKSGGKRPRLGLHVGLPLLLLLCHVKPHLLSAHVSTRGPVTAPPSLDRRRDRRGQDGLGCSSAEPVLKHAFSTGLFLFWRPRCPKHDRR